MNRPDAPADLWPDLPPAPGGRTPAAVFALRAADGAALRGALWRPDAPGRGLALLLPGRAEYLEKLAIPAAELCARGFDVASVDFRGQGLSARPLANRLRGHVGDFAEYEADLAALLAAPRLAGMGPPRLVLAHSMGGPVALRARASGVLPPVPLLLTAPMFGVAMGPMMRAAARVTVAGARRLGRLERWPPFGRMDRPYVLSAPFAGNVLTGDRAVWDWMRAVLDAEPRLRLGMPTLGWFAAAEAAMAGLHALPPWDASALCLMGSDERVVDPAAVETICGRLGMPLVRLDGVRHEPLVEAPEPRTRTWAAIDGWLANL